MKETLSIGFIGAGKAGTALALALAAKGYPVRAIFSRTPASARSLAVRLGPQARSCASAQEAADACDLMFITTPDDAIRDVARQTRWHAGQRVAHCSGALSVEVLAPVAALGGEMAGFHPLKSFAGQQDLPEQRAQVFEGVTISIEGTGAFAETLKRIVEGLGARWIVVPSEGKAAYHAAAVFTSNYVVTLTKTGADLLASLGIPQGDAQAALIGLLQGAVDNIKAVGIPSALTGPIARGDLGTVRRNLDALVATPDILEAYCALGRLTVPIGLAKGTLSPQAAAAIAGALSSHGPFFATIAQPGHPAQRQESQAPELSRRGARRR